MFDLFLSSGGLYTVYIFRISTAKFLGHLWETKRKSFRKLEKISWESRRNVFGNVLEVCTTSNNIQDILWESLMRPSTRLLSTIPYQKMFAQ